jgi:hypothetical protein
VPLKIGRRPADLPEVTARKEFLDRARRNQVAFRCPGTRPEQPAGEDHGDRQNPAPCPPIVKRTKSRHV